MATSNAMSVGGDTRLYELNYVDKKLNNVYKKILKKLPFESRRKLIKSQRQWIVFRDLDCAWAFSAEPVDCLIERTDKRAKELENTTFFDLKGEYISIK
ncbi:lysozyme inhibitor LprI family protein [Legionella shakespearei]|nr:lysozyme inhibitor LprI family protein [Legionella shakespearei]